MSKKLFLLCIAGTFTANMLFGQGTPVKMGTTAASFLEIGIGSAGVAMGSAYTTSCEDVSAIYWNPSKLAFLENIEAMFMYQPWLVDIKFNFFAATLPLPEIGVFTLGVTMLSSGDIEETTMEFQDGTGSFFDATDMAVSFSYARKITNYFSFGFAGKYIMQRISTMSASTLALDMGVYVVTPFFERPESNVKGLQIGMCISNYGGKMRMNGDDTYIAVDPDLNNSGNNDLIEADYRMQEYNLPALFRVGIAYDLINSPVNRITLAVDALHPSNNYEYVNTGIQYQITAFDNLALKLRSGYKTLFLDESTQGLAFGFGLQYKLGSETTVRFDYAFSNMSELGNIHSYTVAFIL